MMRRRLRRRTERRKGRVTISRKFEENYNSALSIVDIYQVRPGRGPAQSNVSTHYQGGTDCDYVDKSQTNIFHFSLGNLGDSLMSTTQ